MIHEIPIQDYLTRCSSAPGGAESAGVLVDARDPEMYARGTIPGALNIPLDSIRQLYHLPKDKNIYIFCQTGEVSREMAELLSDAGYQAWNLTGGYREYWRGRLAGL